MSEALSEAGNRPIDFLRALVQSSMEIKDDKRIVLYGERVLSRNPKDVPILERWQPRS